MNFAFVTGIKVMPESLFSGLVSSACALNSKLLVLGTSIQKTSVRYRVNEKLPKPALKGQQRNLSLDLHRESGMSKLKKQIERNTIAIPFKRRERNVRVQPNWATVRCEVLSNSPPGILASHLSHKRSLRFLPDLTSQPCFIQVTLLGSLHSSNLGTISEYLLKCSQTALRKYVVIASISSLTKKLLTLFNQVSTNQS